MLKFPNLNLLVIEEMAAGLSGIKRPQLELTVHFWSIAVCRSSYLCARTRRPLSTDDRMKADAVRLDPMAPEYVGEPHWELRNTGH
jgi:hypothetical protein